MKTKLFLLLLVISSYTFAQTRIYVDASASGANNGSSWTDAYTNLATSLISLTGTSITEVWVASGTYKPHPTSQTASFTINKNVVTIYGGFAGTENNLSDRDMLLIHSTNETILDGDLSNNDDTNITFNNSTRSENSHRVVQVNANNVTIDGVTISNGYADDTSGEGRYGAGLETNDSVEVFTIKNSIIKNNVARFGAGLMFTPTYDTSYTIESCIFDNNLATFAAGFYILPRVNAQPIFTLSNSLFKNNKTDTHSSFKGAGASAGMIRTYYSGTRITPSIVNNTFVNNSNFGTSITSDFPTLAFSKTNGQILSPNIANNIFWNNKKGSSTSPLVSLAYGKALGDFAHDFIQIYNSIDEDNYSNLTLIVPSVFHNTSNADPLFADINNNDFKLTDSSPAKDTGDNTKIPVGITTDLYGDIRIYNSTVDVGCYEYGTPPANYNLTVNVIGNGTVNPTAGTHTIATGSNVNITATPDVGYTFSGWSGDISGTNNTITATMNQDINVTATFSNYYVAYVDHNATTGANDGTSWANAFLTLQDAVNAANPSSIITDIWVAEGTYYATGLGSQHAHVINKSGLKLYGGFVSGDTQLSDRDLQNHPTIVSGDNAQDDVDYPDASNYTEINDNAPSVFTIYSDNVVLDGFTITNGCGCFANGFDKGAAILIKTEGSTVATNNFTLKNSIIKNNYTLDGGAIYSNFRQKGGTITIENTVFENNVSKFGSSIYLRSTDSATITVNITNSLFKNNITKDLNASRKGVGASTIWLRTVDANATLTATITNSTFANNTDWGTVTTSERGTIGLSQDTPGGTLDVVISNSIFYGNTVNNTGTTSKSIGRLLVSNNALNSLEVYNSIDEDNFTATIITNSANTSNADPMFTNSANNEFTLTNSSPAKDAGDNTYVTVTNTFDLLGNARIYNNIVDMGCYEFDPAAVNAINDYENGITSKIYPNPVKDVLNIELLDNEIKNIEIYTIIGAKILESNKTKINVSNLSIGAYFIKITSENGESITKRFLKK